MAIRFQYNKTVIQEFKKQLAIRLNALPILKSKEMVLRQEERERTIQLNNLQRAREELLMRMNRFSGFWKDFPGDLLSVTEVRVEKRNVVGIKIPHLVEISFSLSPLRWEWQEAWVPACAEMLQELVELDYKIAVAGHNRKILHEARKKTTQKVNLYEKVQIPEYDEAIRRIKRFLDDKDNIAKSAMKIVKKKRSRVS